MSQGITCTAIFNGARTTTDGGWRVSFDVSEDESAKVAQISCLKSLLLQLAIVPIEPVNLTNADGIGGDSAL